MDSTRFKCIVVTTLLPEALCIADSGLKLTRSTDAMQREA